MGLAVGAVTAEGRLHLVFRSRHPLFGPADITDFANRYLTALEQFRRGGRPSGRASVIATLLAKSPCSGLRGRSSPMGPGSSTPIPWSTRAISLRSLSAGIYSALLAPDEDPPDGLESEDDGLDSDAPEEEPPPSAEAAFL